MSREQVEIRATDWLERRSGPEWGPDDAHGLDLWLAESPEHEAAFWRLEHGEERLRRLPALKGALVGERPGSHNRRWMWPAAAALAACLVAVAVLPRLVAPPRVVSTEIGGRETVPLPDGSRVELNTSTKLRVSVSSDARSVWLDHGEAFFDVAHDAAHPFVVHAGPRTITVLGTKFSVRRDGDRVQVAVLEGRVRLDSTTGPRAQAMVTRGDVAMASAASILVAPNAPEKVSEALAWRTGRLKFLESPLKDVAAEFNRYNQTKLVITDAQAEETRIGGNFAADNVEDFAELLRNAYGFEVKKEGAVLKISSPS
ncbi:FecR domain-containing protein [Caulobacter sp. CCH5-E12]|uniref:FecR family protein n=1 Tax=Caulobacter sp. CCH5-E12 TaxID=1768770 RepID=UPI000781CFB8|nr:FecR domain-containing protein [Caulobacter sp. CCH5-E12]